MIKKQFLFYFFISLPLFLCAQHTEQALFICDSGNGIKNIVSAEQHVKQKGYCKAYEKGMLGKGEAVTVPFSPDNAAKTTNGTLEPIKLSPQETAVNQAKYNQVNIFYCPDSRGGRMIEGVLPPDESCRSVGVKAKIQDPRGLPVQQKRLEPVKTIQTDDGKGVVSTTNSAPTDIYKCFDKDGLPSFVASDQTHKFRRCTFFSRSFAGARADFAKQAQNTKAPSLIKLAAEGVGASKISIAQDANAALRCVGAGSVEFNGSSRQYNCATRSFDLTPGTTGGQVVLGDRSANIAAHRLDYFNSGGSCGGEVISSNGRILHLSPTKDCPQTFQIEARRIQQAYIKTISINTSGAFRERQRALSVQINEIANRIGVDPFLVHAVISAESAYKSHAVSHAGAQGLMQLMPATAKRFGVYKSFHTGENIRGGATYLKWLLNEFNGNYQLAIAGYNAGEGNVKKYGYKIPPFIETRAYVPKVMEYYRKYKNNPSLIGL